MTNKTAVLGIPLPNVAFDNGSILSAASVSEYERIIIDPMASSEAIDDVVNGTGPHQTFGGQAIVNGEASSHAFGLRELLDMRRREITRLLERGGLVVCFAHPDALHEGVIGEEPWRRYSWLPEDPGFSPKEHLQPGFGRPGAVIIEDESHPFAPFIEALQKKIAFRAQANEDAPALKERGRVFARNAGGFAIAFDLPYAGGHIVFLPALQKPDQVRMEAAAAMVSCLNAWDEENSGEPRLLRKEAS